MFTSQDMCQGAGQKTVLSPCKDRPRNSKTQRSQKIPVTDSRFLNQMWILYNLIFKTHPQSLPHALLVASSMTPAKNIFLRLLYRFHPVLAYCPEALLHRAALGTVCKPEGGRSGSFGDDPARCRHTFLSLMAAEWGGLSPEDRAGRGRPAHGQSALRERGGSGPAAQGYSGRGASRAEHLCTAGGEV